MLLSNSATVIRKSIRTTNMSSSYLAHITLTTTVWPWVWSIYICFVDILHRFGKSKPINSAPNCALAIGHRSNRREICLGLFSDLNIGPLTHINDTYIGCGHRSPSITWWRHQMETFSALLAICVGNSPVSGEFPAQRPVTRSFDVFFDLCPNKRLSKQSWGWWFETPSESLLRHRLAVVVYIWCFVSWYNYLRHVTTLVFIIISVS